MNPLLVAYAYAAIFSIAIWFFLGCLLWWLA